MKNSPLLLLAVACFAGCHHAGGSGQPGESADNPIVLHGPSSQPDTPAQDPTDENRQLAGNLRVSVVHGSAQGPMRQRAAFKDSLAHRHHPRR